jgi:hypothetical protein
MAHGGNGRVYSVSVDAPIEMVATLLVSKQLSSVPVVDEYGVPVGVLSMTDLMARTDGVEPTFAGLARRRWYHLPAKATAGDLMTAAPPEARYGKPCDEGSDGADGSDETLAAVS